MDAVEEIKSRIAIEDLVGQYVDLKRAGASFKGLCPFHQEKTPSFYVTPSRGSYHCFGCGKGGDAFSFVMELEHVAFPDALKRLAEQTNVDLPEREPNRPSLKGTLYEANAAAARFFAESLSQPAGSGARRYLQSRGFDDHAVQLFEVGFAPDGGDVLCRSLRRTGFDDRVILAAGLALQNDDTDGLRDRFRGRLMFPIRETSGKITGFGGRTLGDGQPKYLNSPQTEIFDKSSVLYGIHLASAAIRTEGRAVLVEGYLDALRAHRAGHAATVASLGTAVTVAQLTALSRQTGTVVLALDPDPAGQAAAARTALTALAELTESRGRAPGDAGALDLRIATLEPGDGDPDDLIRNNPERWPAIIDASVPAFEFYFRQTFDSLDRSRDEWRQEAIDRLLPIIQHFAGAAGWQATWLERLGAETGVGVDALQRALPSRGSQTRRRQSKLDSPQSAVDTTTTRAMASDPSETIERALVSLLLVQVVLPADVIEQLETVEWREPRNRDIARLIVDWSGFQNYDYEMLRETIPEAGREYADDLRARAAPVDENRITVSVALHLERLRHFQLQAQLERARGTLAEVDRDSQSEIVGALAEMMRQRLEVERKLDSLSRLVLKGSTGSSRYGTIDHDSGSV